MRVHCRSVFDLREVTAAIEPAWLRDAESLSHLPRVDERNDPILKPVDHQHAPSQSGERGAVGQAALGEIGLDRAQQREIGRAPLARRASRKLVLHEPIKKIGAYDVPVKLHRDVTVQLKVRVVPEGAAKA